MKYILKK
ncbi:hypothetical protein CAJAP_08434 [Camponotus japonicus]